MPHSVTESRPRTGAPAPSTTRSDRGLSLLLLIGGLVGLLAAAALLIEKIALLENPDRILTCDINPVLSCGSVMSTPQAEAFGVPNPLIGIIGFAVIATIGAGMLAGARYAAWFWIAVQGGVTFAVVFVHWLMYQSLYVIGALCPYCMIVWAVTIPIFLHVTVRGLRAVAGESRAVAVVAEYRSTILTAWYILIVALIAVRFWDYWSTLV